MREACQGAEQVDAVHKQAAYIREIHRPHAPTAARWRLLRGDKADEARSNASDQEVNSAKNRPWRRLGRCGHRLDVTCTAIAAYRAAFTHELHLIFSDQYTNNVPVPLLASHPTGKWPAS